MVEHITFKEYTYLMNRIAYWIITNNDLSRIKFRDIYGYFGQAVDKQTLIEYIRNKGNKLYMEDHLVAEFVECLLYDNTDLSFLPNYVTGSNGVKYYTNTFVDMANRVSAYEVLKAQSPAIVYIKKENSTSDNTDSVLAEFKRYFGNVTCIDDCLEAIQGRGYAFYFDSEYNTHDTITRVYYKKGANCTDIAQLLYRLGNALGYDVQFVHVKCRVSGVGHVRLRLRKNGGQWFYRDGAAVLDGESISSNWCSDGYLIAYNPSWIFNDLYQ